MVETLTWSTGPVSGEASTNLGDERRSQRHRTILDTLSRSASLSFPQAFANRAELEGFYRFVGNKAFDHGDILAGHISETVQRAALAPRLLVCHDSSDVRYPLLDDDWLRENLARPTTQTQGYELHASILAADGEEAVPLGVLSATPFVHDADVKYDENVRGWWSERGGLFAKESKRWFDGVRDTSKRLGEHARRAVHVMDREADQFCLLHWLDDDGHRFIVRAKNLKRSVLVDDATANSDSRARGQQTLSGCLEEATFIGTVEARLGFRSPFRNRKKTRAHPARKERAATLSIRATRVTLLRRKNKPEGYSPLDQAEIPRTITLSAVEVVERNPPDGQSAVRWVLLTNEPISSPADILAVVNSYRRRWLIEEYFKALKTGCGLEKRQMDNATRLLKVLALLMPVAWSLLLTRTLNDQGEDLPWTFLLSPQAFKILSKATPKQRLCEDSSAADAIRAIASLGGHLKANGPPGWLTLQRGLDTLAMLIRGAELGAV